MFRKNFFQPVDHEYNPQFEHFIISTVNTIKFYINHLKTIIKLAKKIPVHILNSKQHLRFKSMIKND